jgi:signal transduction histidine kinase
VRTVTTLPTHPTAPPTARRSGRTAALVVAIALAGAVAYAGWWLVSPGDCTALPPDVSAWRAGGVAPVLRGDCAQLRPGDVVVAARAVPGGTAYDVLRQGAPAVAVEPPGPARLGAALAAGWSLVVFSAALAVLAGYAFVRRRREPAVPALVVMAGALLASSLVTLLGLPAAAVGTGWNALYVIEVQVVYTAAWAAAVVFCLRFPTPLRWVERPGRAAVVHTAPVAALGAGALLVPGRFGSPGWLAGLIVVQSTLTVGLALTAVAIIVRRFRVGAADPVVRQQLRWLGAGGAAALALVLAGWFVPALLTGAPLLPAGWVGLPGLLTVAAIAVALLRFRLFSLDVVAARSIGYAGLTAAVVIGYLVVVGALAAVLDTTAGGPVAVAGAAVVALVVNPLRVGLQGTVNRLLYGDRDDPYSALRRLGARLAATAEPAGALPAAAADVARALRLPFVAVDLLLDGATVRAATAGAAPAGTGWHHEPLVHRGEVLGALVVAARAPDEPIGPAERRLLADLAHQIGAAAQVLRLDLDLRRSREQLVLAREEERRALRRALHDEVGPAVAALALRAETARRLLPADGGAADAELGRLRREATRTAGALRELAYDLRPPALDELGLVGALRERGGRLFPDPARLQIDGDDPAELPAAVEVAAYRIAVEAMANAARHGGAGWCGVRIARREGELEVVVEDDGPGFPDGFRSGVGLTAMRERAAELRGSCTLGASARGGAAVTARLPLPVAVGGPA